MPQQYIEITKEDFEKFLRSRYRVYRPKEFVQDRGELVYDIPLSDHIVVKIYTSIAKGSGIGRGSGEDAIRVVMFGSTINRPVNKKAGNSIVKRTRGWKDNLSDRIDSFIETYHDHIDFYDAIAQGKEPPKKELKPVPQEKLETTETGDRVDPSGTFYPTPENAQKYNNALQHIVNTFGRSFPSGYADFLLSLGKWIVERKSWSPRQKEVVDKVLKRFKVTI